MSFSGFVFVLFSIATISVVGIFLYIIPLIRAMSSGGELVSLEFEVYGMVQGTISRETFSIFRLYEFAG